MAPNVVRNQNIRYLLLVILQALRQAGSTELGGWIAEEPVRRVLAAENYPVSVEELRAFFDYLEDDAIGCTQSQRSKDIPPRYKYRLTAKGVRVATGEDSAPGVGVSAEA